MKKDLINRIIKEGIVDTGKYRYRVEYTSIGAVFERLPLILLDTVAAIDGWEVVEIFKW